MFDGVGEAKWREGCGIFGIYAPGKDVFRLTYYALYALQHRGQESAGIAVGDGNEIKVIKNMGLVSEVFSDKDSELLRGKAAIGHVRYSTMGESSWSNAQPLVFRYFRGSVAIAHNGNLTNAYSLSQRLARTGSVFQSTSDSELIVNLMARYSEQELPASLAQCMEELEGAYSVVLLTEDGLVAARDPWGIRPLCIGEVDGCYVVASESCALDTIGAKFVRDVRPGEVLVIGPEGLNSVACKPAPRRALCIFEFVYFARPDSVIDGETVHVVRKALGRQLAKESSVAADMVVPVPDSGVTAAVGYAEAAGIPFTEGLIKNKYIGRTFIQPSPAVRDLGVKLKLNPVRAVLNGRRIVLVDDSIVRGTTSQKIVHMLREAGAKEVHMAISSPPVLYPCFYGIDTSASSELIAARLSLPELAELLGVDSLNYLSLEGMLAVMNSAPDSYCVACFNGRYPVEVKDEELVQKGVLRKPASA